MEGSGSVQIMTEPEPGGLKTYGSYGSDPQHFYKLFLFDLAEKPLMGLSCDY
jgi:hypothetical protein